MSSLMKSVVNWRRPRASMTLRPAPDLCEVSSLSSSLAACGSKLSRRSAEKTRNMSRMAFNIRSAVGLVHGRHNLRCPTMVNAYFPDAYFPDAWLQEQRGPISVVTRMAGMWLPDNHWIGAYLILMECDQGGRPSRPCSRLRIVQGATPR